MYEWDAYWDAPVRTTAPEGEVTLRSYNATGELAWVLTGADPARRVSFDYNATDGTPAAGLVRSVTAPASTPTGFATQNIAYDEHGNLRSTQGPLGYYTLAYADAVGRDTLLVTPVDPDSSRDVASLQRRGTRRRTWFDVMGRDTLSATIGQPRLVVVQGGTFLSAPAETLWVKTAYDAEGRTDSVARWASPDTAGVDTLVRRWTYDAAGRTRSETAEDGTTESYLLDPAGNVTRRTTRRGIAITMSYDALGRLTSRHAPSVALPLESKQVESETWWFPRYVGGAGDLMQTPNPHTGSGGTIPASDETFSYDEMGNLRSAVNGDAEVHRGYFPNGALRADTLLVRSYDRASTPHRYVLGYAYDLDGRRTGFSGTPDGGMSYGYDPQTGELRTISSASTSVAYEYTPAGQPSLLTRTTPEGFVARERWTYDAEGQVYLRTDSSDYGVMHADTFTYDARGKVLETRSLGQETTSNRYSGIGSLLWSFVDRPGKQMQTEETYFTDALANRRSMQVRSYLYSNFDPDPPTEERRYHYDHTRLSAGTSGELNGPMLGQDSTEYDQAGNVVFYSNHKYVSTPYLDPQTHVPLTLPVEERTRSYYDAQDRLRVVDRQACLLEHDSTSNTWACDHTKPPTSQWRPTFEEYRYDALGRRIMVRARADTLCPERCNNTLRRTVWDGDQVALEISAHGATNATAAQMEQGDDGTEPLPTFNSDTLFYGRVSYVHGQGIDQPLAIVRYEYSDSVPQPIMLLPHYNSRGGVDTATFEPHCVMDSIPLTRLDDSTAVVGPTPAQVDSVCVTAPNPQRYELASHENVAQDRWGPRSWMGSLITGSRDGTGLHFMRNRYYDPSSGRFTQDDPIALAGGMNTYGFANGDPVSYADPYGLKADDCPYGPCEGDDTNPRKLDAEGNQATTATVTDAAVITVTTAGVAVGGLVVGEGLMTAAGEGADLVALREEYTTAVRGLREVGEQLQREGYSEETTARLLHGARRALGEIYKRATPLPQRLVIYGRNLLRYGDRLGPTIDYLRTAGKSWVDIIESASRVGGADLGL